MESSGINIDLNHDISEKLVVHKNVGQEIVIINQDKLKLILIEFEEKMKKSRDWINPLALFLTLLIANFSVEFHDFLKIPANVWQAIFLLGNFFALIWLVINSYRKIFQKGDDIDSVISKIKVDSQPSK